MISDTPGHAEGHEALGAFNMDIEIRDKLEAAARDAQKLATEAEQKAAALQSDHDSMKAALETERENLKAKDAGLVSAQSAMADMQSKLEAAFTDVQNKCADLQAQLDAANAPKVVDVAKAPEPAKATEETSNAAVAQPDPPPAA